MPSARVLRGGELLKQNHTAYATIPSYYAWRQRPIGKGVPKSVDQEMSQQVRWLGRASGCQPCRISPFRTYLLHRVREITPQFPITRKGNCAIWMPGNEAQKRQSWAIGDTGLPIAMSSITTSAIDTPARRSVERTCDDLAILILAVVAVVAGLTFRDYGLGWDDYTHAEYADLLLRMYGSGFKDTGALSFATIYMYGGGFAMAAALLPKLIPPELFETRRLLGAVVGVIGLAVTWRLARRVGGPVAGLATLLLLVLCPTFYGHMFMNPKDAPFAVAMVVLMLGLVRLVEEYSAPSPRTVLIVGLAVGLSIGSRILGGLALVYALIGFVPLLLEEIHAYGRLQAARRLLHLLDLLLPGLISG